MATPATPTGGRSSPTVIPQQKNFQMMSHLLPLREERSGSIRDVGDFATWSLSSSKTGFGVDQLRDNCMDTYWQSDGPQPHLVNITFERKIVVKFVCIYVDYTLDESYTPYKISIRVGNGYMDLQEVEQIEMDKPTGWVVVSPTNGSDNQPIKAFHIQIAVLGNHQNGRDTHLRQVKIYSPSHSSDLPTAFSTTTMMQHVSLR